MRKIAVLFSVLLFSTLSIFAQNIIKGKVVDFKDGTPIPGATIKIKGENTSTTSSLDGSFEISGKGGATLEITEVGHAQQTIKYLGGDLVVRMIQDTKGLSEVVVTAFGIRREKKALGYAVTTLDKKVLESRPDGDIGRLLSGKAPGVDILASSGISGSGTNIQIRGANSITGPSDPLFVVDGVPLSGNTNQQTDAIYGSQTSSRFSDIDPNNIETINILKGLSATVLYGEQGRNGVILITTKNGSGRKSSKKAEVTVAQSYFVTKASSLPELQNSYGGGFSLTGGFAFFSNWGPKFTTPYTRLPHPYTQGVLAGAFPELAGDSIDFKPNDNFGAVIKDGHVLNTSVNVSAALGANGTINANYSFLKDQGFLKTNNVKRSTFGIGINTKLANNITVTGALNYVSNNFVSPTTAQSSASGAQNGGSGIFADLIYTPRASDLANWPYQTADGLSAYYRGTNDIQNPLWTLNNSLTSQNTNRAYGNFALKYDIMRNWNLMYRVGYDVYSEDHALRLNKGGRNRKVPVENEYERGIYRTINVTNKIWDHSLITQYQTSLNTDIRLDVTAGFNSYEVKYDQKGVKSTDQLVFGLFDHSNFVNQSQLTEDGLDMDYVSPYHSVGVFAQAGVSYKDYLFLNVGGRNSWSAQLEKSNRSLFYPSTSISFIPTSIIPALQGNTTINYLKLRAGYATSANFPDAFSTRNRLLIQANGFVDKNGAVINSNRFSRILGNKDLQAELLKEFEMGLEAKFFNSRFSIDFTWYNKKSTNQILDRPLDPSSGFDEVATNAGNLVNRGIELGLGYTVIRNKNWNWQLDVNYTRNRSMVSNLPSDISEVQTGGLFSNLGNFAINGQPFGVIKGTYWQRQTGPVDGKSPVGPKIVGQDGYYIASTESVIIGDPNQNFRMSGISTLSYKSLEFRMQWDYVKGGVVYASSVNAMTGRGLSKATDVDRSLPIILPGVKQDGTPNDFQTALDRAYFNTYIGAAHEGFLYDATTIRLREISITYAMPKSLLKKTPFGGISFALTGMNLWHKAPYFPEGTNYDPETSSGGVGKTRGFEFLTGPQTRRFGASLRVTF